MAAKDRAAHDFLRVEPHPSADLAKWDALAACLGHPPRFRHTRSLLQRGGVHELVAHGHRCRLSRVLRAELATCRQRRVEFVTGHGECPESRKGNEYEVSHGLLSRCSVAIPSA